MKINQDKIFKFINYILGIFFMLISFYPLWFVLIASFSNAAAVAEGEVWIIPKDFTLAGYEKMLMEKGIWTGYWNTICYTVVGTTISLVITIPAGYALSRKTLPFRSFINKYFLLTMFIGGGLIPTYILVSNLNLVNTFAVMVILGSFSVWNMIICRNFFESNIPISLIEAAKIDGGSELGIFFKVVMPMAKSIIAVMTLFFAVGFWNSYYNALIYLRDNNRFPLQLILRSLLMETNTDTYSGVASQQFYDLQSMKFGIIVVASLPVMILYPFVQKYFVKGVMVGAIKG